MAQNMETIIYLNTVAFVIANLLGAWSLSVIAIHHYRKGNKS